MVFTVGSFNQMIPKSKKNVHLVLSVEIYSQSANRQRIQSFRLYTIVYFSAICETRGFVLGFLALDNFFGRFSFPQGMTLDIFDILSLEKMLLKPEGLRFG